MTSSVIGIDTQTGQRIEIPKSFRLQGLYIIGAPGTGKSGLIENLIIQDIEQGLGVGLLDPHGGNDNSIVLGKLNRSKTPRNVIGLAVVNEKKTLRGYFSVSSKHLISRLASF